LVIDLIVEGMLHAPELRGEAGPVRALAGRAVPLFSKGGTVNGTPVLAPGDANLAFKRHIERAVTLRIAEAHASNEQRESAKPLVSARRVARRRGLDASPTAGGCEQPSADLKVRVRGSAGSRTAR
jgi:hypothetical protein